jgi:hypothetical protein
LIYTSHPEPLLFRQPNVFRSKLNNIISLVNPHGLLRQRFGLDQQLIVRGTD